LKQQEECQQVVPGTELTCRFE